MVVRRDTSETHRGGNPRGHLVVQRPQHLFKVRGKNPLKVDSDHKKNAEFLLKNYALAWQSVINQRIKK